MADIIPWGMNWGSSFVYNECNTQGLPLGTFGFGLCDFYNFGAAHSYISTDDLDEGDTTTLNYDFIDTGCIMALTTPAASCINDVDVIPGRKFKFITFEQFGVNSRCFLSNIVARNVGG